MNELKSCPFCGGKGHISSREIRYIGQNYFGAKKIKMGVQVICGRCKARGGVATGEVIYASYQEQRKCLEPLEHEAIEAWNRRTEADVDEAYQNGLDDAWDCLCEIARMDADELESIFDIGAYTNPLHGIVNEYTPMRTIETLKEYKEQKNDEIHVGDEISFSDGTTGYVIMPDYNEKDMLVSTSDCACLQLISKKGKGNPFISWEKTGMRNGEIVRMVKDIKEKS